MARAKVEGAQLSDVIFGDCIQTSEEANTARTAALKPAFRGSAGVTIQRQCASGMQSVIFASQQIQCGTPRSCLPRRRIHVERSVLY